MVKPGELCDIIKTSSEYGVSEIQFSGISIRFGNPITHGLRMPTDVGDSEYALPQASLPSEVQLSPGQRQILDEMELDNLAIDDPEAYETHRIDELIGGVNVQES